jgi:uncharacterized protein with PIN domain
VLSSVAGPAFSSRDYVKAAIYAFAIEPDGPLLYKSDDFKHTDVRRALSS